MNSVEALDHLHQGHGWPRYSPGYWRLRIAYVLTSVFGQLHTPSEIHDWEHESNLITSHHHKEGER